MTYQAIVRNSSDLVIANQNVGMRISILQGNANGSSVYVETQTPVTNAYGLINIEIGTGNIVNGDFSTIDWANDTFFIKTEIDPNGGANYTITGASQLASVPYALYAANSGSSTPGPEGPAGPAGLDGKTILNGAGAPASGLGTNGDFYIDTIANTIQFKAGGTWGTPTSLVGPAGTGSDGDSAYDIWLSAGNTGTEADFLASLVGAQGAAGADGANGADGTNGTDGSDASDGATAYQIS
jgi:hypothetical protein